MEYNKKNNEWIGTPREHIQKLLETHNCICDKLRFVLQGLVDGKDIIDGKDLQADENKSEEL